MVALKPDGTWKSPLSKLLTEEQKHLLCQATQAKAGDLLLLTAGEHEPVVRVASDSCIEYLYYLS